MKMKRILLLAALGATPWLAGAQFSFSITGKIGQFNSPARIYLSYTSNGTQVQDSAVLHNGQFQFNGKAAESVRALLFLSHNGDGQQKKNSDLLYLFLEKTPVILNSTDSVHNAAIRGGKVNEAHEELKLLLKPVMAKKAALYATLTPETRKSKEFLEAYRTTDKEYDQQKKDIYKGFIAAHPESPVSLDAVKAVGGPLPDVNEVAPLYNSLTKAIQQSLAGKKYGEEIAVLQRTAPGVKAPDFTQNDTLGNPVALSSFKGKYVLVDFWASWCGPCRAENPNVAKAFHQYAAKGFTVLGVSLDSKNDRDKWLKAVHDDGLTWTQVSDLTGWANKAAALYGIHAIPQNVLIDPQGIIIGKNLRGEDLQKKLAELFK